MLNLPQIFKDFLVASRIEHEREAIYSTALMKLHTERWGYSYHRSGVLIVGADRKFLLVEEKRAKINGEWRDVHDIWNIPGSSREPKEWLAATAEREAEEEGGCNIILKGIVAIIDCPREIDPYIMVVYLAEAIGPCAKIDSASPEISSVKWFTAEEILQLAEEGKLRSSRLVTKCLHNYQKGLIIPIDIIMEKI